MTTGVLGKIRRTGPAADARPGGGARSDAGG